MNVCIDKCLPPDLIEKGVELAIAENKNNIPFGLSVEEVNGSDPYGMAVVTRKLWKPGRTINIAFLDGTETQQKRIKPYFEEITKYSGYKFNFLPTDEISKSDVRISFNVDSGSWSYLGTDALAIPKTSATMCFGWLKDRTAEAEYARVVRHEGLHMTFAAVHEHQNPSNEIPWNKEAVYKYYMGPPNNWSRSEVDSNLFERYSKLQTNFTEYDPKSIMSYAIPPEFLTDPTKAVKTGNTFSENDIKLMREIGGVADIKPKPVPTPPVPLVLNRSVAGSLEKVGDSVDYQFSVSRRCYASIMVSPLESMEFGVILHENDTDRVLKPVSNRKNFGINLSKGSYTIRVTRPIGALSYFTLVVKTSSL